MIRQFTLGLLVMAFVAGWGSPATAEIYRWVDERGVDHFSDRAEDVPAPYRDQITSPAASPADAPGRFMAALSDALAGDDPAEATDPQALPDAQAPFELQGVMDQFEGPMLIVVGVVGLVMLGFVLAFVSLALLVGCRLVGQESPGFKKAYGVVLVQFMAGMVVGPGVVVVLGEPQVADLTAVLKLQAVSFVALMLVNAGILRSMLCDSFLRSLGLAVVVNLVLLVFGIVLGIGIVTCAGGAALLGGGPA